MKNLPLLIVLLFTLYACNEGFSGLDVISDEFAEVYYSKQMGGASVPPPPPPPAPEIIDVREEKYVEATEVNVEADVNSSDSNKTEKKIIKDGRIGLEVQHLETTKQKIDSLVQATGAYYANDRFDDSQFDGVSACTPTKTGATTTYEIAYNPALVTEGEIKAAIQDTPGCENPNDRPYTIRQ